MGLRWRLPSRVAKKNELTWPVKDGIFIADTPQRCRDALKIIKANKIVGVDVEAYGVDPRKEHPKGKGRALSIQFCGERGPMIFVPLWTVIGSEGWTRLPVVSHAEVVSTELVPTWEIDPVGREELLDVFLEWLEDETATKVLHNGKFDRHILANHGINLRGHLGDTLIMDYFYANGEMLHGLKECMRRYFKEKGAVDYGDVFKTFKPLAKPRRDRDSGEMVFFGRQKYLPSLLEVVKTQKGVDKLVDYAVKDPKFTVQLYKFLRDKLDAMPWIGDLSYLQFYERVARPYSDVLFDMERTGCPIDLKKLYSIRDRLDVDIEDVKKKFFKSCVANGVKPSKMAEFNINAGAQVADLLYEELGMRCEKTTGKGAKSTSKSALEAIAAKKGRSTRATKHAEIVEHILKYRALDTLRKMFIRPLCKFVPEYGGRVHSNFKQNGTETGRLSSSVPNLENIPANKKDEVYQLRSCFIAPPGYVVGDIDLAQIEVRFTAHFTKDKTLIELLEKKWDQHLIASCMLSEEVRKICGARYENGIVIFSKKRPPDKKLGEEVEAKMGKAAYGEIRRRAKVLNFGIIYGMGPTGFANQIGGGATKADGEIAIAAYFKGFPGLKSGIDRIKAKCRKFGYVKTFMKRYCMIPEIYSEDWSEKGAAERQAFNYVIQGSAADMIMLGMLLCHLDKDLRRWGVKMINQIHDEIVFLIKKKHAKKAAKKINAYISRPYDFTQEVFGFTLPKLVVDTPADLGTGCNWMEAKK